MENFKSSGLFTKQAHVHVPDNHFEEEHGRKGFFGKVSHIYHQNPPVNWTHIEGNLRPRSIPPLFNLSPPSDTFIPLLSNQDVVINAAHFKNDFKHFFRNADFDELYFVHNGSGRLESIYGHLNFKRGDYIVIPRGTTYKIYLHSTCEFLKIESKSEFEQPNRGMLGPNALYDQSALTIPEAALGSEQKLKEYVVEVKRLGEISSITYPFNPLDASGWKGSLYPYILSIYDYCPVMSHRYHMPPSAHTTFVAQNFVVCSFVERPLESFEHGVLKVPFYHSNIDYDEVLFYHSGDFFSRDNIDAGALTFHPQGIHHGPHPKAYEASKDKSKDRTYTDEYAVMIDARYPLNPTSWFLENENRDYWKSWMKK